MSQDAVGWECVGLGQPRPLLWIHHLPNPWYLWGQHLTNVRYHSDPTKTLWASQRLEFLEWQCS